MLKRWRCSVCGYLHTGDTPPEVCPVCGVGSEKFVLIEESAPSSEPVVATEANPKEDEPPEVKAPEDKPAPSKIMNFIGEMQASFKPHPVMAHFPNALIPTLGLFLAITVVLRVKTLDHGIYLLLGVICLSAILTLATGIYSWQRHFGGARSKIFHRKLILGVCLVLICLEMFYLRFSQAELFTRFGIPTFFFLILAAGALFCVTLLGHYGGILVFGPTKK